MIIPKINFSFLNKQEFFHKLKIDDVKQNTIITLFGHNGADKTTLQKILSGFYPYEKRKLIKYDLKRYIKFSKGRFDGYAFFKWSFKFAKNLNRFNINYLYFLSLFKELLNFLH